MYMLLLTIDACMQHFEAFVVGHFRCHARDILMACEGYVNGLFLNGELEKRCSITFKNEVASCIKPIVDAFIRIGAHEAQYFLPSMEKNITVPRELGSPVSHITPSIFAIIHNFRSGYG